MSYTKIVAASAVGLVMCVGLVFADEATSTPGIDGEAGAADGGALVVSGDGMTQASTTNEINTNTVDDANASTTDVVAQNDATTTSTTTAETTTGDNTAQGNQGTASVVSGNAIAIGEAINVVNTNIVDSEGLILFLNALFGGGVDLRALDLSYFFGGNSSTAACTDVGCGSLAFAADNTATVGNDVIVRADTSGNQAFATGDASVSSGNAYAVASVLNLINSNFIKSNYLLLSFNSFGDTAGDIILPNSDFFSQLFAQGGALAASSMVTGLNSADVVTVASTTADTGGNTATSSDGTGVVGSGEAYAGASALNAVNQNLVGGTSVFLLFRVWGDWTGKVQGLPEGITWAQTPMGIQLFGSSSNGGNSLSELTASTTNDATVRNGVQVWALTGDNEATSASGTASVSSGNAYAAANVLNFVNTTVLGRNWIFAIFNIFGNWSGNITFGQPDLWVGASVETTNPTRPGSDIIYHVTIANRGDADAHDVRLVASDDQGLVRFLDESDGAWDLGTIRRGESRDLTYRARIGDIPQGMITSVPLIGRVSSAESDATPSNNTEEVPLVVSTVSSHAGPGAGAYTPDPVLSISYEKDESATTTGSAVPYSLLVKNAGGAAYLATLTDTLTSPTGKTVYSRSWNLGTIKSGEEVRVNYTVGFGSDIEPGTYRNMATITGRRNNVVDVYAVDMMPVMASSTITIASRPASRPQVLGAATSTVACTPIITSRITSQGKNQVSDVHALQVFLNAHDGQNLTVTDFFDTDTEAAVRRFQETHASDVLAPWGLSAATGVVGVTTSRVINALACGHDPAPLAATDVARVVSGIGSGVSVSVQARASSGSSAHAEVGSAIRSSSRLHVQAGPGSQSVSVIPDMNGDPSSSGFFERVRSWFVR